MSLFMKMRWNVSRNKNTILFLAFLLLAGISSLFTRTGVRFVDSVAFCMGFLIYAGLIVFWMQSVRARMLPGRARSYVMASGVLMIAYLVLRVWKFRVTGHMAAWDRYVSYAYNVPMVFVATLFLMTAFCILWGERKSAQRKEVYLLIVPGAFSFLVMTNDLHRWFYRPKADVSLFAMNTGTYDYGIGFGLFYFWLGLTIAAGVGILIKVMGKGNVRILAALLIILIAWLALILIGYFVFDRHDLPRMYFYAEINIFSLLGIFETCIRGRLIPHNENYAAFFSQLGVPALITDKEIQPVWKTKVPIQASEEQLRSSLQGPTYLDEDTRLSGMAFRSGYAFWTEDESGLNREKRRLASANELLSEENDLIAVENKLKEKKARLDAQNEIYARIAAAIYPKQKRISELLENAVPGTEEFRDALATSCILNAYSKRKSNLLLLSEETLPRRNRELFLALQESARFLQCRGIRAAAVGEEYAEFPIPEIHALYDTFETVLEAYLPCLKRMTVSLAEDGLRLAMEADGAPALPVTALLVERRESDETTFLNIRRGKGGEA